MISQNVLDNIDSYAELYSEQGWVSIPNFYQLDFAESLFVRLQKEKLWEIATLQNGQPFVVGLREFHQQTPQFKHQFMNEILDYARNNDFQYFYEFIRLIGADSADIQGYDDLKELLLSRQYQEIMCQLTSLDENTMIDAQLTRYAPGCFLKQHCDTRLGNDMERHAALIVSLTKNWRADFGGLLNVQTTEGNVIKTLTPQFNTLNILSIPFEHFVSQVANYADRMRFSLIGWLWKKSK